MKTLLACLWLSIAALAGAQGLSVRSPFYSAEILKPPAAGGAPSFPSSGLIHYWTLDESEGNPRVDSVGMVDLEEMMSVGSSVPSVSGKRNNAAQMTGASGYLGTSSSATPNAPLSIVLWYKKSQNPLGTITVIGAGTAENPHANIDSAGNFDCGNDDCDPSVLTPPSGSSAAWHVMVLVVTSSQHKISIDGGTFTNGANTCTPTTSTFYVSMNDTVADGVADEIGIWDRALTQQEAIDIWNVGAGLFGP